MPWSKAAALWGGVCVASLALTHALRLVIKRRGWLSLPPAAVLGRVAAGAVLTGALTFVVTRVLAEAVYGTTITPLAAAFYERLPLSGQQRNQFIFIVLNHVAWAALYLAIAMQRHRYGAELRQAQLGEALRTAELRLLKSQLNPHFLFNALNGVRSLIAEDTERARAAVTHLARLLRHTLAAGDEDLVTLERELEMVDDYLALETIRFAERLRVERDIAPEALSARLPAMLMQTLVENAVKHGIAALQEGGTLRIAARVGNGELEIELTNPFPREITSSGNGVGLRNAAERLRLLCGPRANIHLDTSEPGIAVARVRLPA